ncbi:MAG: PaaI family thioesterase [Ferrovibrio sp.]|uniref:PaaI family thioesterase n=1 Tax=Ferrovibrio sp. TaxID=1917215 RepID=UPI0026363DBA|nr:PaaI family thioesterase [Ferrovibrio sp.]MCW0233811.1 PaaI family thioesterase [Ferrovibrio sp.]
MSAAPQPSVAPARSADLQPPTGGRYAPVPLETLRELEGIELFRKLMSGELPGAPIAELMKMWIHEAEPGRIVFAGRPDLTHYNPIGSVHGGYAGTMLDSCMSCAVQSMLPRGMGYTTLEYKVSLVRAITHKTGTVYAEGNAIQVGSRVGTAEGRIVDANGKILATGTTTCLIFPI